MRARRNEDAALAMYLRTDSASGKRNVVLAPGELYATAQDEVISTVLGSCVCICLRDQATGIAGMNHYLLPGLSRGDANSQGRAGLQATRLLVEKLASLGASGARLTAKVFGGAHVLRVAGANSDIPDANVAFALAYLQEHDIRLLAKDVGGTVGREVRFHTGCGDAYVRMLGRSRALARTARPPSVELGRAEAG